MSSRPESVLFIVNPKAGPRGFDVDALVASVIGSSAETNIRITERAGHATELAHEAAGRHDLVVAVGGDGTVNEVAQPLIGTSVSMGILPAGSGNALARSLDIPLDLPAACRNLLEGHPHAIDVGYMDADVFLSTAGIGLDAEVCWRFNNEAGSSRGVFPYVQHSLDAVMEHRAEEVRLSVDEDEAITARPDLVAVANTSCYGFGAEIAPGAAPDDGQLDVCILEGISVGRAVLNAHRLFNGTFDRTPGLTRYRAQNVRIERASPGRYQVDGEAREGGATLTVSITPGGLNVIVPD